MSALRIGSIVTGCLSLGFAAGWYLREPPARLPRTPPTAVVPPVATPQPKPIASGPQSAPETLVPPITFSVTDRLAALREMKSKGLDFGIRIFSNNQITPEFAKLYDLTPAEIAQLNQAYQQTQQRLDALIQQHAKLDPTSTDAKLIVTVGSFPAEGGQVYNDFLSVFSTTLGASRYALFNDISEDALEKSFGSFGLEHTRYEVTRRAPDHGMQFYGIKRSNALAVISASYHPFVGTTWGTLQAEKLKEHFPALRAFSLPSTVSTSSFP